MTRCTKNEIPTLGQSVNQQQFPASKRLNQFQSHDFAVKAVGRKRVAAWIGNVIDAHESTSVTENTLPGAYARNFLEFTRVAATMFRDGEGCYGY